MTSSLLRQVKTHYNYYEYSSFYKPTTPSIRLKIVFQSILSGTYGCKGGGTLSFPSACSTILAATDMYKGKPQQRHKHTVQSLLL